MRRWTPSSSHIRATRRPCLHFRKYTTHVHLQHPPSPTPSSSSSSQNTPPLPDPFSLLAPQLSELRQSLFSLLSSSHPRLGEIARYYFHHPSKQIRPIIVLLFARATNGLGRQWEHKLSQPQNAAIASTEPLEPFSSSTNNNLILPTQKRLAQIVEMMHTASLLHDDVIDESALRRGSPSAPAAYGSKRSILGGNFVLGRASVALSRLGDQEVTHLIASVLSNLVEGEILQTSSVETQGLKQEQSGGDGDGDGDGRGGGQRTGKIYDAWNIYLQKTYLKTASLMAKGARASVTLGGCKEGDVWREIAYAYGRNLGIAFQLVDDILDYESASATLGKPGGADLQLGLTTGPALYAWEEHPEMGALIQRKFEGPNDVEMARDFVSRSSALGRTRELARGYAEKAKEVLQLLPDSEAKGALYAMADKVISRRS